MDQTNNEIVFWDTPQKFSRALSFAVLFFGLMAYIGAIARNFPWFSILVGSVWIVFGLYSVYYSTRIPLLVVGQELIQYREPNSGVLKTIILKEIDGIAWPAIDDMGIRMKSGDVLTLSFVHLPKQKRQAAIDAVNNAIDVELRDRASTEAALVTPV